MPNVSHTLRVFLSVACPGYTTGAAEKSSAKRVLTPYCRHGNVCPMTDEQKQQALAVVELGRARLPLWRPGRRGGWATNRYHSLVELMSLLGQLSTAILDVSVSSCESKGEIVGLLSILAAIAIDAAVTYTPKRGDK